MGGMIRTTGTKVESSGARVRQGPALVDDAGFIFGGKPAPREVRGSEQSSLEGAVLLTRMGNHIFDVLMF